VIIALSDVAYNAPEFKRDAEEEEAVDNTTSKQHNP